MFGSINNALSSFKEASLGSSAKAWINHEIGTFATVTALDIDTQKKTIRIELVLNGDPSPITVTAGSYELSQRDGATWLTVRDLTASREWVTGLLNKYILGRSFKVPGLAALVL